MFRSFLVLFISCVGFSVALHLDFDPLSDKQECGPNEVPAGCRNTCPPQKTCKDSQRYSCLAVFEPCGFQCHCKEGYIRKTEGGECIPIEECEIYCTSDEVYTDCKPSCLNETCSAVNSPSECVSEDSEPCEPGCICQYGYLRDDKDLTCIPDILCSYIEDTMA